MAVGADRAAVDGVALGVVGSRGNLALRPGLTAISSVQDLCDCRIRPGRCY